MRIVNISFDLLVPTRVYRENGSVVGLHLFYDATIEYFGREHLPYAIPALVVLLVFVLLPLLLLLLYPMRCFQQCLSHCGVRWLALHIFMDAFQGCYKDGTNGTRDCRYFPALHLILRIVVLATCAVTLTELFYPLVSAIFIVFAIVNAVIQPYKQEHSIYNVTDTVIVLTLAMLLTLFVGENIATLKVFTYEEAILVPIVLVAVLPLFYISFIVLHWLCFRCEIGQRCVSRIRVWMKRIFPKRSVIQPLSDDFLPDRLLSIAEYASPEDENTEGEESHSSGEETAY